MVISNEIFDEYSTQEYIKMLCKMYPNNQELGAEIRKQYETYREEHSNKKS